MLHVDNGQCGMCAHFGESHSSDPKLVQIRKEHEAPEQMTDECGHPKHAPLHLVVSANSGCDGFEPAQTQQM